MSREIQRDESGLYDYLQGLYSGERNIEWYNRYRDELASATAWTINNAIDSLIDNFDDYEQIEQSVSRFIRACASGLDRGDDKSYPQGHFLGILSAENGVLQDIRRELSSHFKEFSPDDRTALIADMTALEELKIHYQKIQNILFPALEKSYEKFRCVKLMWHIQDDVLRMVKQLIQYLNDESFEDWKEYNKIFGLMYLKMGALLYREKKILFPVAFRAIPPGAFTEMNCDIDEYGTAFGVPYEPDRISAKKGSAEHSPEIDLSVGKLLPGQIDLMLKNLPMDITFVDENDRVRYYSQGRERIFPRSPGIIGREVQNCHPPGSAHIVQKIVEDFKSGKRKEAEFWIDKGGKFIHIRYFPLFEEGIYRGVIEVSQDIAPLRELTGEKRLLDE